MPKRRDEKIDISKARAKMLSDIHGSKKRESLFGNYLKKYKKKQEEKEKIRKEKLKTKELEGRKKLRADLLRARAEQKLLAIEKRKKNEQARIKQATALKEQKERKKLELAQDKLAQEKKERDKLKLFKKRELEKENIKKEKKLLREKKLAKIKEEKQTLMKARKGAQALAKKRKEEVALKKAEQIRKLRIIKARRRKEKRKELLKNWSGFLERRKSVRLAKKIEKEKLHSERNKYFKSATDYKKKLNANSVQKDARLKAKNKSKAEKKVKLKKEKKIRLRASWINFIGAFNTIFKKRKVLKKEQKKDQITKQKLFYLKREKEVRVAKKEKQIQFTRGLLGIKAAKKQIQPKKEDQPKKLIKISEKELQKKKLIKKELGFFKKLVKKNVVLDKEHKKQEAKKELEKKAKLKEKEEEKARRIREKELRKIRWSSPEILKANLIRDEVVSYIDWKKNLIMLFVGIFVSIMIIGVSYQYLNIEEKKKQIVNEALLEKIDQTTKKIELAKRNVKLIVVFQEKMELVSEIMDDHIYWNNFFRFFEDNISNDVYFFGFSGDVSGVYSLAASAKNFNTIAEQIKSLRRNESVLVASTQGGSVAASEIGEAQFVNFNLNLELDTNIFLK